MSFSTFTRIWFGLGVLKRATNANVAVIFEILVGSMAIGAVLANLCMPANAAVGDDGTTAPNGTSGATVGTESPDNTTNPELPRIVDAMSSAEITRFKKRCIDVIESRGVYDRDLRQLCLLIWRH